MKRTDTHQMYVYISSKFYALPGSCHQADKGTPYLQEDTWPASYICHQSNGNMHLITIFNYTSLRPSTRQTTSKFTSKADILFLPYLLLLVYNSFFICVQSRLQATLDFHVSQSSNCQNHLYLRKSQRLTVGLRSTGHSLSLSFPASES